jgi:hypothetical protein
MGLMSRNKGKVWERWCADYFRKLFPAFAKDIKRVLVQARDGAEAPDLVGVPYFWVEAKHRKRVNLQAALRQADGARKAQAKRVAKRTTLPLDEMAGVTKEIGKLPLVLARDNNSPPIIAMYAEDFARLFKILQISFAKEVRVEVTQEPVAPDVLSRVLTPGDFSPDTGFRGLGAR